MADVFGTIGEALVLLRMDGSQLTADMKKQRDELEANLKKTGEGLKTVGSVLTASVTAPIVAVGVASAKSFMDFESGMKKVQAAFDPTYSDLKKLEAAALEWGAKTKFSAVESADALAELGKAGFTSAQAISALPAVLQLATISGMSLADAATLTADAITQFNLKVTDAAHVNDVLVKAAQSSTIDVQQLGESFKYVGPVAAGFGMTIEETAAILAAFGNSGIKAEMAGTALRNILTDLANPTKGMRDVMEQLGIETLKSADGTFHLTDVIDKLKASGATAAQVMQMFGDRAGPAMVSMVTKGSGAIKKMEEAIDKADGAAKRAAETVMSGLGGAMEEMRGSVETAGVAIGRVLAPVVTAVAKTIGALADITTQYLVPAFEKLPVSLQLAAGGFVAIAAAAGPIIFTFGAIMTMIPSMAAGFRTLQGVLASLNLTMIATGPAGTGAAVGVNALAVAWTALGTALAVAAALAPAAAIAAISYREAGREPKNDDERLARRIMIDAYGGGYDPDYQDYDPSLNDMPVERTGPGANTTKRRSKQSGAAVDTKEYTAALKENTGALGANSAAAGSNAASIGKGTKALADAKKEAAGFSSEVKKDIIAYDAMGKTSEEIAKLVGKSETAVKLFTETNKSGAAAAKAHADAMQKLRDQFSGKDLFENAKNLSEILNSGIKLTKDELEEMAPVFERAIQKMIAQGKSKTPEFKRMMEDWLKAISPSQQAVDNWSFGFMDDLMKGIRVQGPSLVARDIGTAFGAGLTKAAPAIKPDIERFVDAATGEIGLRFKAGGQKIIGPSIMDGIFAGLKSVDFAQRLANVVLGAVQSGGTGKEIGSAIGGTIGQQIGVSLGASIAQSIGGAAGGIIGNAVVPVLGGIIGAWLGGYIGSLFGGGDEDAMNARSMRDEILQSVGGASGLLSMLNQADLAGVSQLGSSPGGGEGRNQTAPRSAQQYVDDILNSTDPEQVQRAWDHVQPLVEAVQKQFEGLGIAVKGVNTYADALADSFNKSMTEQDKVMDAQNEAFLKAMKERGATSEEIAQQEIKFAEDAKNRTYVATEAQIASYGSLGTYVAATFADIVRRTGDPVTALLQMEGAFKLLKDAQEKFGLEGSATTQRMVGLYNTINNNKDVFQSLSGLGQIMKGLGQAMAVDKDLAAAFGADLAANFKTLTDRGVDTRVAMALMQPQLQQLWEAQQKFGKFTDEATNAMLEQAEAQGIVGAEMRSVNDKILDVLLAIADVFGADIPAGVRRTQDAIDGLKPPKDMDVVVRPRIEYPDDWPTNGRPEENPENPGGPTGEPDGNPNRPGLSHGGFSDWGMGSQAVLHGREIVAPEAKMEEWLDAALPRVGDVMLEKMAGMMGRGDIVVAPTFNGMLANEARQFMQENLLPMMITVLRDSGPLREQMRTTLE